MYKKRFMLGFVGIAASLTIAACGGGGGGNDGNNLHSPLRIALYGTSSMAGKAKTTAMLKSLNPISEAVADGQGDDTAAALQAALTAAGVTAQVQVGVMDSTTLHDYVATNFGSTLPTDAQLQAAPDPTTWVVENFTMADIKGFTQLDPTSQQAALDQFQADLIAFVKWQHVAGNWVVLIDTDPSIDPAVNQAINTQINQVISRTLFSGASLWDLNGFIMNIQDWPTMMSGPDGNTPNDSLKALKTQEIVRHVVELQGLLEKQSAAPAEPASGASS
jgi:hypothetical protein